MAENPKRIRKKEITGSQIVSMIFGDGVLQRDYSKVGTYAQLRAVRKDPTVILGRSVLVSCILAGSWTIEADDGVPDDVKEFLEQSVLPLREDFLSNAVAYGRVDYGWMGFEKIFKVEDGRIVIDWLKPLLHDITHILVTKHGRFAGYRQRPMTNALQVDVPAKKCLHIAYGVEAGNLHGMPLLEGLRQTSDMWDECNDGARKYDKKIAGAQPIIKYPPGTATVGDDTSVDNGTIAADLLNALVSGGGVTLPKTTAETIEAISDEAKADAYKWDIDLLEDRGKKQAAFNDRLKYLDSQKVRGLMLPERAILEGQFGTKAEAGVHIGVMITNMQQIDRTTVRMVNEQLVNQLVYLNYGDSLVGKVRLVCAPLVDTQIAFLQKLYVELNDPNIDLSVLKDRLNVPEQEGGSQTSAEDNKKKVSDDVVD